MWYIPKKRVIEWSIRSKRIRLENERWCYTDQCESKEAVSEKIGGTNGTDVLNDCWAKRSVLIR